ncbi:Herc2, partial [Symbiodinium pilosum]
TDQPDVRMGMPCLKQFARPLDWTGIEDGLRRYAELVDSGAAGGQQAIPPMMLRVPGEPRRHLRARMATLSSPFDRNAPGQPIYLYLHLQGFQVPRRRPTMRLEGVAEHLVGASLPPKPDERHLPGQEQDDLSPPTAAPKRKARQRR